MNENTDTSTQLEWRFDSNGTMTERGSDYEGSAPYSLSGKTLFTAGNRVAFKWLNNDQFMTTKEEFVTKQGIFTDEEYGNNKNVVETTFNRN